MAPGKKLRFNSMVDEISEVDGNSPTTLSPALRTGTCLPLDFSLPSAVFRADHRLDNVLLEKPACIPTRTHATISVSSAHSAEELCTFDVVHKVQGEPITVGDVLSCIHENLRQPEPSSFEPPAEGDIEWFHARRVRTLGGFLDHLDPVVRRDARDAERDAGVRLVDWFCGDVRFNGVVVRSDLWEVVLGPEERYNA
ncbi:hypothetical protein FB45DRAFT_1140821 [Roridomyces roridus]|uniref:DUF6699 domain-containing protein n=1 Tax=Roridomyces roridus TaxID=1738132 RepID=A0AAD7F6T6_9AGAR|nr:hypothetical protein FB45DRAFT_1140821 [Roridomyces roridus]